MATVNYNGKEVSDENVKTVLDRIASTLAKDVSVSSGDRQAALGVGAGSKSLHLKKRAADFHVAELSDEEAFKKLQENKSTIFDADKRYEVIWHGVHTETMGQHVHIGRFESGTGVNFYKEGTTEDTKGKYEVASGYAFVPSTEMAALQIKTQSNKEHLREVTC